MLNCTWAVKMAEGSSPFTPPNTPPGWEVRLQQMEARLAQREADAESMLERMHTLLDVQANMYYKQLARTERLMQKQLEDQAAAHQKQLEQMDRIITQQVTMQQAIIVAAAHAEAARKKNKKRNDKRAKKAHEQYQERQESKSRQTVHEQMVAQSRGGPITMLDAHGVEGVYIYDGKQDPSTDNRLIMKPVKLASNKMDSEQLQRASSSSQVVRDDESVPIDEFAKIRSKEGKGKPGRPGLGLNRHIFTDSAEKESTGPESTGPESTEKEEKCQETIH